MVVPPELSTVLKGHYSFPYLLGYSCSPWLVLGPCGEETMILSSQLCSTGYGLCCCCCCCIVSSVVSDSVWPHRQQPTRLRHPWDSPGKNTGVGCHFLLQSWKWKVKVKSLSRVWLLATPWTAAYQAPPSMGFSRQEYWSGLPLPSPGYGLYSSTNYDDSFVLGKLWCLLLW